MDMDGTRRRNNMFSKGKTNAHGGRFYLYKTKKKNGHRECR